MTSVKHLLRFWLHGVSLRSQYGYTILGVILFSILEIWKLSSEVRKGKFQFNLCDPGNCAAHPKCHYYAQTETPTYLVGGHEVKFVGTFDNEDREMAW